MVGGLFYFAREIGPKKPRIVYILIYMVTAQLFYMFMQKPWDNCALEASGAASGVQLAAKGQGTEKINANAPNTCGIHSWYTVTIFISYALIFIIYFHQTYKQIQYLYHSKATRSLASKVNSRRSVGELCHSDCRGLRRGGQPLSQNCAARPEEP